MLNWKGLPAAKFGVPLTTPVAAPRLRPGGKDPLLTVQL
jgi:hypothetical protein